MSKRSILESALPAGLREPQLAAARESFWAYCKLMNPSFYKDSRPHLRELCDTLQALAAGKLKAPNGQRCRKLAISEPPRHGKSYTMSLYNQWCLGRDPNDRIINVSYNEILSGRFSKGVRDGISATRVDPDIRVFADVFPGVRIKDGDAATQMWSLEGSYFSFLGAGFGGTITGVGCKKLIIDDPIKNHIEAFNVAKLEDQWDYYANTLLSRVEEDGIVIIMMTRWATKDLIGRALAAEPGEWSVLNQPACTDEKNGSMLCPALLSFDSWKAKRSVMAEEIFLANFQNTPVDRKGRLYNEFAIYDELPREADGKLASGKIIAYTDTADTGTDYLCTIIAKLIRGQAFVLDVVYSDAPMEDTEPIVARALFDSEVQDAIFESNNGGRGFSRNVKRILWDTFRSRRTRFVDRNQRSNKQSRILSQATYVMMNVLYPADWDERWPRYYAAMRGYMRKGRNEHDDAPDATTGLAEYMQGGSAQRSRYYSGKGARRI